MASRLCGNDETGVFEWIAFCAAVFGKIYATKSKPMSNERLLWVR